ncbi:MAG: HAD family hydrolase [Rhodospirillales bacterium]|nr:MAG: HAD family hydrolase [Rhodospirillales bacterium]
MPPSAPKALVFDWDNTLVDTWPVITTCYNATFAHFGMPPWTEAETRARAHKSLRDAFPELFGPARWEEAREVFYATFRVVHLDRLRAKDGAGEMLRGLRERGLYLAVVSNKMGPALRIEAGHLGWSGYFERIVGATDTARDKPAPDPVARALEPAGFGPDHSVWFVGDTAIDLECAHNTGCLPVLIRDEPPEPLEFERHPPAFHVRDCHALWKLI